MSADKWRFNPMTNSYTKEKEVEMTSKPDQTFEEALDEILKSSGSVELREYEIPDAQREQGARPAVYPVLTDEAKAAILTKYHSELERIIPKTVITPKMRGEYKRMTQSEEAYFEGYNQAVKETRRRAGIQDKKD